MLMDIHRSHWEKLEWGSLLAVYGGLCQTEQASQRLLKRRPDWSVKSIDEHWSNIFSLRTLVRMNSFPPIGSVPCYEKLFRQISLSQSLSAEDLLEVLCLLRIIQSVQNFVTQFAEDCKVLQRFRMSLSPLLEISSRIDKAIHHSGKIRDNASVELRRIRQKLQFRRLQMENSLKKIIRRKDVVKYLQDDFFTIRSERYVIPIRVDGHGRIHGNVIDYSDSGQTIFLEPIEIVDGNQELLSEKVYEQLEILKILKSLRESLVENMTDIEKSYDDLITLDTYFAEARFAETWDCQAIKFSNRPVFKLYQARHPLVKTKTTSQIIANDILLDDPQKCLVITGPNAGGKTVVLKTAGLLCLMAKAGFLVPADQRSEVSYFEHVFVEIGDHQSIENHLSTFSAHMIAVKQILSHSTGRSLVLLDELSIGTEYKTGMSLAQAILEYLVQKGVFVMVSTHFEQLKALAAKYRCFRNAAMIYSLDEQRPYYQLVLDMPGKSYGFELVQKIGLPASILSRALSIRGEEDHGLESLLSNLHQQQLDLQKEKISLATLKEHWEQEKKNLSQLRKDTIKQLAAEYYEKFSSLITEYSSLQQSIKKRMNSGQKEPFLQRDLRKSIDKLVKTTQGLQPCQQTDGDLCRLENLRIGAEVHILPFNQNGTIEKCLDPDKRIYLVQTGQMRIRLSVEDLRYRPNNKQNDQKPKKSIRPLPTRHRKVQMSHVEIPLTFSSSLNSIDLHGQTLEDSLHNMWNFIDKAFVQGRWQLVLIHGHGTGVLKTGIRRALRDDKDYDLIFRPGEYQEGGDGVTIVFLRQ